MSETHIIRCGNASKRWHYKNARKSTFSFLGMCGWGVPCMVNDVIYANREKTRENRNNNAEEMKTKSRTRQPMSLQFIYRRNAPRLTVSGFFTAITCAARIIRTEWSNVESEFISEVYHHGCVPLSGDDFSGWENTRELNNSADWRESNRDGSKVVEAHGKWKHLKVCTYMLWQCTPFLSNDTNHYLSVRCITVVRLTLYFCSKCNCVLDSIIKITENAPRHIWME